MNLDVELMDYQNDNLTKEKINTDYNQFQNKNFPIKNEINSSSSIDCIMEQKNLNMIQNILENQQREKSNINNEFELLNIKNLELEEIIERYRGENV